MKPKYATTWTTDAKEKPKASDFFIVHLDNVQPGPVVLLCRESNRQRKSHLEYQEARLVKYCKKRGFIVVAIYYEISSATPAEEWDRQTLEKAALKAKEFKAVLVAMSPDRFIRGLHGWRKVFADGTVSKRKKNLPPSVFDFKRLQELTYGVKLATLLDPDTDPKIVRSIYTKMGLDQSKPGDLKRRREDLISTALKRHEQGWGYRRIGHKLDIPWSTIRDWIHRN